MVYCSAGLNRIIVRTNGNINPCYSIYNPIGNIDDFDISDLKATICDQKNCFECDKNFIEINKNKELIKKKTIKYKYYYY